MANLSDLILLRNDPQVAEGFLQAAIKGDVDAQYGMGLIYAEGRGIRQDEAKSFYWLSRAMEQGDEDAALLRRIVATSMTPEQFTQAELLMDEYRTVPSPAIRNIRRKGKRKQVRMDLN